MFWHEILQVCEFNISYRASLYNVLFTNQNKYTRFI